MSPNNNQPDSKPASIIRQRPWGAFAAVALIVVIFVIWRSPTNSFHPTCTYTVNAQVSATVEIEGQKLSSTVIYQNSHSRGWIASMNSAGCKQLYGDALIYRLANDSVLIVRSRICRKGAQELAKTGRVNYLSACTGKQALQDSAFIVDSASRPGRWRAAINGVDFRIDSMTASSTRSNPTDDIASIAPNLLKSDFKYGRQQWSQSPETTISFQRRYKERRHKPDRNYEFVVLNERF